MPTAIYHAKAGEIPQEIYDGGAYSRAGLVMDNALISFVTLNSGYVWPANVPPDQHPMDQLIHVTTGRIEMILNKGDSYVLNTGDSLYIPADVPHFARLIDNRPCTVVEVYSPIRTDFLYIAEHQTSNNAAAREKDGSRIALRPWSPRYQHESDTE